MKINKITPLNGHCVVEPIEKEQILVSDTGHLETIGKVIAIPETIEVAYIGVAHMADSFQGIKIGDYVAFELWDVKSVEHNDKKHYLVKTDEIICKLDMQEDGVASPVDDSR